MTEIFRSSSMHGRSCAKMWRCSIPNHSMHTSRKVPILMIFPPPNLPEPVSEDSPRLYFQGLGGGRGVQLHKQSNHFHSTTAGTPFIPGMEEDFQISANVAAANKNICDVTVLGS